MLEVKRRWRLVGPSVLSLLIWMSGCAPAAHRGATPAVGPTPNGTVEDPMVYMPLIPLDETPTPTPTPLPPALPQVVVRITADGDLYASTFNAGSFEILNGANNTQTITRIEIDLSTALFPDMVFDPFGLAGDQVAKDLVIDSDPGVGFQGRIFDNEHDDGYDVLEMTFNDFDPGEQLEFSIDVDPTSIRGAAVPGPNQAGSVSGLELIGATFTVTMSDNQILTGHPYRLGNSLGGSEGLAQAGLPAAPLITVLGVPSPPAVVTNPNQTIRVTGTPGFTARVLVVEGGLFTEGVPGGGFDLDPFEANSALAVREYTSLVSSDGFVDVPIVLSQTGAEGGFNYITAVQKNNYGMAGATSDVIVLELEV